MPTFADTAAQFAAAGIPVLPVGPSAPLVSATEASTDMNTIANWQRTHPTAVVGIPTGRAMQRVIIEVRRKAAGERSLAELEAVHGRIRGVLPEVWIDAERSYFLLDHPGYPILSSRLAMGLYRRADGGYFEVPDSAAPEAITALVDVFLNPLPPIDDYLNWLLQLHGTGPDRRSVVVSSESLANTHFELIDDEAFLQRAPVAQLIDGILPLGGLAVLFGEAGSLKTFLAIDLAFCIATGMPWAGSRRVQQGLVVYIVAEGSGGFPMRVDAWKRANGASGRQGVLMLPRSVSFMQDPPSRGRKPVAESASDVDEFLARLDTLPEPPVLVVIDTLARCFGGDENSARDMGLFVKATDHVREHTGAAVLALHHSGWSKTSRERGSTALRGAADTIMLATKKGGLVVTNPKQKDTEEFLPLAFAVRSVELSAGRTSLVLDPIDPAQQRTGLTHTQQQALAVLEAAGPEGLAATDWQRAFEEASGFKRATFYRALNELVPCGFVKKDGDLYLPISLLRAEQSHGLTPVSSPSHETAQMSVSQVSPPFRGETKRPRVRLPNQDVR